MSPTRLTVLVLFFTVVCPTTTGWAADLVARGVSPGALDRIARVSETCPTFSWEITEGAQHYEVVVYRVDGAELEAGTFDPTPANEVLFTTVSGRAASWTPESSNCFVPGESYVWFIRAVMDAETGEGSEWSEPRFFEVAAAPSAEELERAIEVIRRWEASSSDGSLPLSSAAVAVTGTASVAAADSRTGSGSSHPKSVITGTAAIRGEQPDGAGETYGVVGTSASPDGAGIGAANTAGGPDLVLDGTVPAEFTEAGVDRPSASPQTFSFSNTGGGGMTLDIDGIDVVTTATDQDTIGALTCGNGQLAKWNGATWVCAPDLDTDTLSGLSCATWQIPKWNGSIWECNTDWDTLYDLGCSPGQIPKFEYMGLPGWSCAPDNNTTYSLGPGLILDGDTIRIDPAEFTTQITTIDSINTIDPEHLALAIGTDGLGLIAYFDTAAQQLRVAHCEDPWCNSVVISTPDSTLGAGRNPAVAIGTDGLPIISYWGGPGSNLKVAHCEDLACTSADSITGYSLDAGEYSSIAIGPDGLALIIHSSNYNGVEVVHCRDVECTWGIQNIVDYTADVGCTSLAIGSDGLGLIVYHNDATRTYIVAHCNNSDCSESSKSSFLSANVSTYDAGCSVITGIDGLGYVAYIDTQSAQIYAAHCSDLACTSANASYNPPFGPGRYLSMIPGSNHHALMIFGHGTLWTARCIDKLCGDFILTPLDRVWFGKISAAMGPDGRVLVAFATPGEGHLKIARLAIGY